MSGTYRVPFAYTGNSNVDLCMILMHTNISGALIGIHMGQSSDVGDSQEEVVKPLLKSGQTSAGTGGSAVTPAPNDPGGSPAANFTARQADTTPASGGTITTHPIPAWNIRQPYDVLFSEAEQIILRGGRRLTLELPAAGSEGAADSLTISGYLLVAEFG